MTMLLIAIFIFTVFLYSLVSGRLERTVVTAPIVFTGVGMLVLLFLPELRERQANQELSLWVAEIGLVLLLFTDASRTEVHVLKRMVDLPARLLSAGMLLTILFGALAGLLVFRQLLFWEACILAAVLAPTDAGLGQIIVKSPRVPMRIRQALNVEAGLNDGLSVPFLLFFMVLVGFGVEGGHATLRWFVVEQLGYGVCVGVAVGLVGGWLLELARRTKWMAESFEQIGVVALPVFCMIASEAVGASMFIAAFVCGLAVQVTFKEAGRHSVEFAGQWGDLFNFAVFFTFGLRMAGAWPLFSLAHALYAVISLTVVRIIPVAIALMGTRLSRATVLFMGWFGPRGLASIVLGLVYLEHSAHGAGEPTIRLAVMATVWASIVAHGLTAMPGIRLYAERIGALDPSAPEHQMAEATCKE